MQSKGTAGVQPLLTCFSAGAELLAFAALFQNFSFLFSNQYLGPIRAETLTLLNG